MSNPLIERRPFLPRRGITLRRWRLQNFKSVRNAEVELRPLTVVVGANSAGKSTLLQSIRAASQGTGSSGYLYPLNGRGVRLGTVAEVKYRGPGNTDADPLIIGADFELHAPRAPYRDEGTSGTARPAPLLATLSWEVKLGESSRQKGVAKIEQLKVDLKPEDVASLPARWPQFEGASVLAIAEDGAETLVPLDDDEEANSIPHYFTGQFSGADGNPLEVVDIAVAGGFPQDASVMRPRAEILFETWRDMLLRRSIREREDIEPDLTSAGDTVEEVGRDLLKVHGDAGQVTVEYADAIRFGLRSETPESRSKIDLNLASSETFRDAIIQKLTQGGVEGESPFPHRLDDLGRASNLASSFLNEGVRYLGPLREEPRVAYPDSPEGDDSYVGAKGEFTASVLQRHGDRWVSVPLPDRNGVIRTYRSRIKLMKAVSRWAKYLDIGESFSVADQGRFGIQMQVRQTDVEGDLDLTSVGTGVSQLLPVIVLCVQAPIGTLLLIEQPELHLNPKVQQRLADFLLAIAQSGRHLIVETHSEYLISRLRRRVAEDETDSLQDTIGIYYAKRVNGATTFDLVRQNEYGGIDAWPEDFFDQATEEEHAILSAAVKKRRTKAARPG